MTKKDFIRMTTCAAVFGIVGGASFQGVNYLYNQTVSSSVVEEKADKSLPQTTTLNSTSTDSTSGNVSEVAENVLPSIVAIDVTVTETQRDFFGRTYSQEAEGSGSGIIVAQNSKDLYIVTNNHVVADASKVSVKFSDDAVHTATVKGTDSDADLAVVCVSMSDLEKDTISKIKVATLGDSDKVQLGDQAIAIGNALGYGTSVTVGYISAKDREVAGEDVTMKFLQTDAAINPGNSGGALVDSTGTVIGINSAKYADEQVEGMGFAIPVSTAVPIINEIIQSEQISEDEQGYLGIRGTDEASKYAEYYNMPKGAFVSEVSKDSPAEKAGMQKGDIIVEFNGREITSMTGLQQRIAKTKAGTKVKVVVKRSDDGEYKKKTLTVTLGKKSESADYQNDSQDNNQGNNGGGNDSSNGDQNPLNPFQR